MTPTATMFDYLDRLRASGIVNAFASAAYLERRFALAPAEARAVLVAWMETFDGKSPVEKRARRAGDV